MTQYPPPSAPDYSHQPRTNGLAVASLICSIAGFCVVFLGGLLGIILGILGLRKARDPNVGGRGMAIAGIVIGVLSFLTSGIAIYSVSVGARAAMRATEPERLAARRFVQDLNEGNVAAAQAEATADLTPADLRAISTKLRALGPFKDMTSSQISINNANGVVTATLHGTAHFANGDQPYEIKLTRVGGTWKVSNAEFP